MNRLGEIMNLYEKTEKKLKKDEKVSLSVASLVQMWDKCEDAKLYLEKLGNRINGHASCTRWYSRVYGALCEVESIAEEMNMMLHKHNAFEEIEIGAKEFSTKTADSHSYPRHSGTTQRAKAASTNPQY
jgi:hypothetical protein